MKNQESPSKFPTGHAASGWPFHWGWALALALCLVSLAVFGLLDLSGPSPHGTLHEHPSGTFHVSLLLLVAALGLGLLDFIFGRTKSH